MVVVVAMMTVMRVVLSVVAVMSFSVVFGVMFHMMVMFLMVVMTFVVFLVVSSMATLQMVFMVMVRVTVLVDHVSRFADSFQRFQGFHVFMSVLFHRHNMGFRDSPDRFEGFLLLLSYSLHGRLLHFLNLDFLEDFLQFLCSELGLAVRGHFPGHSLGLDSPNSSGCSQHSACWEFLGWSLLRSFPRFRSVRYLLMLPVFAGMLKMSYATLFLVRQGLGLG